MRKILRLGVAVTLGLVIGADAQAQARRQSAPVIVSAPRGTRVINTALPADRSSGGVVIGGLGAPAVETLLTGDFPVPGLGFDFAHLAAVNRNLGVRALIDPITQHRLALARQIRRETPILPLTLPLLFQSTQIFIVQQPPLVILQQPPEAPVEQVRYVEREAEIQPARPPEPPREVGELVLVRRDGEVILVVAFFAQRDRIVYVTRDGNRRSVPLAELDIESTLRMNEERGTMLRLPV